LVSPSRKSFLRALTDRDLVDIGPASLAAELYAVGQGADFIRTHDVAAIADALTILEALAKAQSRDEATSRPTTGTAYRPV
jgi:dihydropteroate synthase type 2